MRTTTERPLLRLVKRTLELSGRVRLAAVKALPSKASPLAVRYLPLSGLYQEARPTSPGVAACGGAGGGAGGALAWQPARKRASIKAVVPAFRLFMVVFRRPPVLKL